jgi:hypothetical protein
MSPSCPQTFAETLAVLEQAVEREPESGLAWSFLSFLYGESYSLQFAPLESPLEQTLAAAQKGAALESENQIARAALSQAHFFRNEREFFLREAEAALALNPNAPAPIGFLGWQMALNGEWKRRLAILGKGMELNPHNPGWFHMAPYMYFYRKGNYWKAYGEALEFKMPQLFWDPLMRVAALGQLGKAPEAAQALTELLQVRPDSPKSGAFSSAAMPNSPT